MKTRLIALFLVFAMLVTVLLVNVFAADSGYAGSSEPQTADDEQNRSIEDWLRENEEHEPLPETPDDGEKPSYYLPGDVDSKTDDECGGEGASSHPGESDRQEDHSSHRPMIRPEDPVISDPVPEKGSVSSVRSVSNGSCGDDLTWSFDNATGVLTITGSGDGLCYNRRKAISNCAVHKSPFTGLLAPSSIKD